MTRPGGSETHPRPNAPARHLLAVGRNWRSVSAAMPRGRRYLLRPWVAATSIIFGAFSTALAEGSADPSATALVEALVTRRQPVGGPFDLIDHTGRRRTDADFRGKLVVLYFGYTYCPDVCPTELQSISLALDKLGAAAEAVQPLFITVDPERDTPARLADFVSSFHPRLIGLTGSLADIRKTAIAYRTFFVKNSTSTPGDYSVDHTGFIYLVGKDERYLGFLPPGSTPDAIADAIRARLGP
jgi:cytochrome oxidase Cu insertion factor (SCO1/SenC/PrrC family)